ncbi:hypothetical protein [Lishizhenia sp.]|uniref:hypothetical protein n=1 Tax=Lishizhenia sp. TaxID=2497594 RepID=UPI00299E19A1|nr:hypothetical protein [Lishizhenia sp.]MDX1446661.1 hypothetical protein [Lishizhenia sp.]
MNTKEYIYIEGIAREKVIEAVQAMSNLYADVEFSKGIEIFESNKNQNSFIINFSFRPDFERFKYFVNYLHYPEVKDYKAQVRGFWTVDRVDGLPQNQTNQRVMLYVSDIDEEGDNVHATFQGETTSYKLGFAVGEAYKALNNLELEFDEYKINSTEFDLTKTIQPNPSVQPKQSGKGCVLTLAIIIIASGWIVFG